MPAPPQVLDIRFRDADEIELTFTQQVSKGGYFFVCDDPAPRGTAVLLRFGLPGIEAPIEVPGEVAFAAPAAAPVPGLGAGMAIQFRNISPQMLKAFKAAAAIARAESRDRASSAADAPAAGPAEPVEEPAPVAATDPESSEWSEEPIEVDAAEPAGPEETLEDTGPADGEAAEPDEAQARSILARLNALTTENLYNIVRQLPFHQKIVAAKRGNRAIRALLIQEGNQKILNFVLQNPQISVPEIIQLLKLPTVSQEVIQTIAKNANWAQSEEVRLLLVTHSKTPLPLSLTLLNGLNINNLARLAKSQATKAQIKSTALRLLEQRRKGG